MKNNVDFIQPIVEVLEILIKGVMDSILKLTKMIGSKIFNLSSNEVNPYEISTLKCKKQTTNPLHIGVDVKTKKPLSINEIDFRKHSFIVGASGFGKTNLISLLQENSLKNNRPIIFIDPKGDAEAQETFKNISKKYNRSCFIFSENDPKSIKLNPLRDGSINQVSDRLMKAFEWSDSYYKDCAQKSLNEVLIKIKKSKRIFSLEEIYKELERIKSNENLGLLNKIEAILLSDFGPLISSSDGVSLGDIRKERASLYIGLSTQGYGETAMAIGKIFLGELLHLSYSTLSNEQSIKEGLETPLSIYFDEFGALVTPQFIELQNKCRGAGMELTMAVQTKADIDVISPSLSEQIIENAGNIFILKQRLKDSAQFLSEAIGTTWSIKRTLRFEDNETQDLGSERDVRELIVHPDIIKNLKIGQCVLLRQGPTKTNILNIRKR